MSYQEKLVNLLKEITKLNLLFWYTSQRKLVTYACTPPRMQTYHSLVQHLGGGISFFSLGKADIKDSV